MKPFMDKDFLLSTDTAKELYHEFAAKQPILDYHCHIVPREIAEDRRFDNITQVWLGADHYKWRQMRSNGVEEKYITGDATDKEKFIKWAETLEMAIGNPLYHWSHLELRNYFGYEGVLNGDTAEEVWEICNKKLQEPDMSARGLIKKSNVTLLCTTDDPVDTLEWHAKIAADETFDVQVLPTWRPDRAVAMEKADFNAYIDRLSEVSGIDIQTVADLQKALEVRMEHFDAHGCKVSDHGLPYVMYKPASEKEVEAIFAKRRAGQMPTALEMDQYKTAMMLFFGRAYTRLNWTVQLHYGVKRDNCTRVFKKLGPDAGIDSIASTASIDEMIDFLDALDQTDELPRTIIYSLNPTDNAAIGTAIGCFQNSGAIGKIQHGSAWWFNDHKEGMTSQMTSLGNLGLLGNFIGMLTDSRSFLSYTRHEYFRRIMCDLIGKWVENGEYPKDMKSLKKIVEGISYKNAVRYFGFNL